MDRLAFLETLAKKYDHNLSDLNADTSFEDLHMDSYEIVDFLMKVEDEFGIVIDGEKMLEIKTMQDILDTVKEFSQEEI
ncbi:MAG: hypothetical protein K6A40_02375 [Solobacterium sp.]|nr:hypothetical protein [Solobacterium sp.]